MKLKDYTKEELETLGYNDIAYKILEESKKPKSLKELFEEVCSLLELDANAIQDKISNFFDLITNDQRFIMLPKGLWDLKIRHQAKVIMEPEEEDEAIEETQDDTDMLEPEEEDDIDYYSDDDDTDDDTSDDDLKDFVIKDEEDEDVAN